MAAGSLADNTTGTSIQSSESAEQLWQGDSSAVLPEAVSVTVNSLQAVTALHLHDVHYELQGARPG